LSNPDKSEEIIELLRREFPALMKSDAGFRIEIVNALEGLVLTKEDYAKLMDTFVKLKEDILSKVAEVEDLLKSLSSRVTGIENDLASLRGSFKSLKDKTDNLESKLNEIIRELDKVKSATSVPVTEEVYVEKIKDILTREFGVKLRNWVVYDSEGVVYGHAATVEALLAITGKGHYLIKIKPIVTAADVGEMKKIGELYYKKLTISPKLLLIGNYVNEDARKIAKELGVEVRMIE